MEIIIDCFVIHKKIKEMYFKTRSYGSNAAVSLPTSSPQCPTHSSAEPRFVLFYKIVRSFYHRYIFITVYKKQINSVFSRIPDV